MSAAPDLDESTSSSLLHLPSGVLHTLSQLIQAHDRKNLRLTCKALHKTIATPTRIQILGDDIDGLPAADLQLSQKLASAWPNVTSADVVVAMYQQAFAGEEADDWYYGSELEREREITELEREREITLTSHWELGEINDAELAVSLVGHQQIQFVKTMSFLENVATALMHWSHLQCIKVPFSKPVVTAVVRHCTQLQSVELSDQLLRCHCSAHVIKCPPLYEPLVRKTHVVPCIELLATCESLRSVKLNIEFSVGVTSYIQLLSQLTQLTQLHVHVDGHHKFPTHFQISCVDVLDTVAHLTQLRDLLLSLRALPEHEDTQWEIPHLPCLQSLHIGFEDGGNDNFCSTLEGCSMLTSLYFSESNRVRLAPTALPYAQQLVRLHMPHQSIDEPAMLYALTECKQLAYLATDSMSIPDDFAGVFCALSELSVWGTLSCNAILHALMPCLCCLRCEFIDTFVKLFAGHQTLETLYVPTTWVAGGKYRLPIIQQQCDDPLGLASVPSLTCLAVSLGFVAEPGDQLPSLNILPGLLPWNGIHELHIKVDHLLLLLPWLRELTGLRVFKISPPSPRVSNLSTAHMLVCSAVHLQAMKGLDRIEAHCSWMKSHSSSASSARSTEEYLGQVPCLTAFLLGLASSPSITSVLLEPATCIHGSPAKEFNFMQEGVRLAKQAMPLPFNVVVECSAVSPWKI